MSAPITVTAAVLVIGDEILSGRTKDQNIGYIAEYLGRIGVDLREARVVPDVEEEIVAALNALSDRYDYVITTGGIGPTHDDITADAVARAFGVPVGRGPARDRDHAGALRSGRPDAGAAADGAHARGLGADRQSDLPRARLPDRQRVRAGRRPLGDAGDARLRGHGDADRRGHAGRVDRGRRRAGGAVRRSARPDRRGQPDRVDRFLSVVQGRAVQQPDRRARQGRGGGRGRQGGGRGDARCACGGTASRL